MSRAPLLEARSLAKSFGGIRAVRDVSFALEPGEIVGLLGPNGSGKTTVLNLASGALRPTGGAIRLRGEDVTGRAAHRIARLGVARTFQLVRILPSLTLAENVAVAVAFGRHRRRGMEAERIGREALAAVGLATREDTSAADLPYIDQKRLELARALAAEPDLLLLDEWLAGLNPAELRVGIDLVRSLNAAGTAILLVEHIMEAVRALCPRCIVMNAGAVIADGATEAVLRDDAVVEAYLGTEHA